MIYKVYDRIFGDFPAKNTVHAPYMYGSANPMCMTVCLVMFLPKILYIHHICMVPANPMHKTVCLVNFLPKIPYIHRMI